MRSVPKQILGVRDLEWAWVLRDSQSRVSLQFAKLLAQKLSHRKVGIVVHNVAKVEEPLNDR
jgi:hypothetical protein